MMSMTTMGYFLRGEAMIHRFTLQGYRVGIAFSEPLFGSEMVWWGLGLIPRFGPELTDRLSQTFATVFPLAPLGWGLFILGALQVIGPTLAWFGIAHPVRRLRIAILTLSIWWWATVAAAEILSGLMIGPATYTAIAILTVGNLRKAWVSGRVGD